VVGHKGKGKSTSKRDGRGELSGKEIDHENRESSKDEREDTKVPFRLGERIELMGKDEEQGRMEIGGVLLIKFDLPSEIVSGVVEGMDFVHPEGLPVKSVKPQGKAYEETGKNE
jgi:hypothetical protein